MSVQAAKPSRRLDPRIERPPLDALIKIGEQSHSATVLNLCRRGMRFHCGELFQKGDKLVFELLITDNSVSLPADHPLRIKAKVMNDYGNNNYGVKFLRVFSHYEISCIDKLILQKIRAERQRTQGTQYFPIFR
ncbi:MAG: PilZ domain-containing protein [Oscillospiraceae bacterium]|nr:PilZ domain-containing protein [Oscillospiraceae bacterium]